MKKINVLILVLLTVFLVSCNNEEDMSITSSDFFSETSITEFYLEAEFIDQEEEDAFFDNLRGFVIEYTILEDGDDILPEIGNYTQLNIDSSSLVDIPLCSYDNCNYVVVPLYSEQDFSELNYWYLYNEGNFCVAVDPMPTINTDDRTVKILILIVDSSYPFAITNDLSVCPYSK